MAYFVEALRRYGGMYGSAWKDGVQLVDAIEVSGATDIGRIEVPLVARETIGYKPGRQTSEGTLRVQKFDTSWELFVNQFLSQSLAQRIANRGTDDATLPSFDLKLEYNDPYAFGKEVWQLKGCQIWRMTLGFAITDDIVEREYPLTWDRAIPVTTYVIDRTTGRLRAVDGTP